jgi:signal transduction histidine kinase
LRLGRARLEELLRNLSLWLAATLVGIAVFVGHARNRRRSRIAGVRSQIAADLHDGVGLALSRIAILSEVARQQIEPRLPDTHPLLTSIGDNARRALDDMSDAVWFIDPDVEDVRQIVVRIRTIGAATFDASRTTFSVDSPAAVLPIRISQEQRRHVYLLVKEALTNVQRHAGASHVRVRITAEAKRLQLQVVDDGVGFDPDNQPAGTPKRGVANMRTRASALGGTLTIGPATPQRGTCVTLEVPLQK